MITPNQSQISCSQCRRKRRRCTKEWSGCLLCLESKSVCKYPSSHSRVPPNPPSTSPARPSNLLQQQQPSPPSFAFDPLSSILNQQELSTLREWSASTTSSQPTPTDIHQSTASTPITTSTPLDPLDHILTAWDLSLLEHHDSDDWDLTEDDNLQRHVPSTEDWGLAYRYLTRNGTTLPSNFNLDADSFIQHFFEQPAALWLSVCAIAALKVESPVIPENIAIGYFTRAREAVAIALTEKPCVEIVQACSLLHEFAFLKGQPVIGSRFLKIALEMMWALRLDIDPEDSPRAYWQCYKMYQWSLALSSHTKFQYDFVKDAVRPPRELTDKGITVFSSSLAIQALCNVYHMIQEIKTHNSIPPSSLQGILVSEGNVKLSKLMISTQSKFPANLLLVTDTAEALVHSDYDKFLAHFSTLPPSQIPDIITLNMTLLSSMCLLQRPKLYLSSLKTCHPRKINQESQQSITSAINQSLQSAHRISCLYEFFFSVSEGSGKPRLPDGMHNYYKPTPEIIHALFEAITVFWFITCRMDPMWWLFVTRGGCPRDTLRERLLSMFLFVKKMEKELGGRRGLRRRLAIGMSVRSIGEEVSEGDGVGVGETQEPWIFMGLLGLKLEGGVWWKGPGEAAWCRFWKAHS
ncbi:hypothetical protein BCR33DRAFT_716322 [Rhizoclosmatium globosum]|uniref:Zn(2)-C6 fungal-type domain-containing protein n=1 Tax=Rhizoclosmatium globosum TaxID=329046 RepID=A0A1Y2CFH4_9FUNG|nr:hypothetical protein BCR33DRAFT_716322 [Rhizoclosmatium globosum]|eukprot:ORY45676.1 hypothetical protein BCR33DRAFT_716322 [Rhizoclosmatium globosum]